LTRVIAISEGFHPASALLQITNHCSSSKGVQELAVNMLRGVNWQLNLQKNRYKRIQEPSILQGRKMGENSPQIGTYSHLQRSIGRLRDDLDVGRWLVLAKDRIH
tara:strand:- start:18 stop:332 length:315 start_codon:yes stop_codon:yes gene_type:complete